MAIESLYRTVLTTRDGEEAWRAVLEGWIRGVNGRRAKQSNKEINGNHHVEWDARVEIEKSPAADPTHEIFSVERNRARVDESKPPKGERRTEFAGRNEVENFYERAFGENRRELEARK